MLTLLTTNPPSLRYCNTAFWTDAELTAIRHYRDPFGRIRRMLQDTPDRHDPLVCGISGREHLEYLRPIPCPTRDGIQRIWIDSQACRELPGQMFPDLEELALEYGSDYVSGLVRKGLGGAANRLLQGLWGLVSRIV